MAQRLRNQRSNLRATQQNYRSRLRRSELSESSIRPFGLPLSERVESFEEQLRRTASQSFCDDDDAAARDVDRIDGCSGGGNSSRSPPQSRTISSLTSASAALYRAPWIIHPFNPHKVKWDLSVAVMIIYSLLFVPFRIGFAVEATGIAFVADIIIDGCFAVDMVLTFFVGYTDDRDVLVFRQGDIALRYLRGFFAVDFVSVFPTDWIIGLVSPGAGGSSARITRILRLVRLMKLARLFRLKRLTSLLEEMELINMHDMMLIKVIVVVMLLIHLLACMIYWIAMPVCADGSVEPCDTPMTLEERRWTSWARMFQVDQMRLGSRYLAAVHLVTATVMAVGYGDLYPANSSERVFSILIQLIGAVFFGFILSAMTHVIQNSDYRAAEQKRRMTEIKEWLHVRELPPHLKHQVWTQLLYMMSQKSVFSDEQLIWKTLPTSLRNDIVENVHATKVERLQHLFGAEDRSLVAELAVLLQPLQLSPGECLVEAGEPPAQIFIVKLGRIEALLDEESIQDLESLVATGALEPPLKTEDMRRISTRTRTRSKSVSARPIDRERERSSVREEIRPPGTAAPMVDAVGPGGPSGGDNPLEILHERGTGGEGDHRHMRGDRARPQLLKTSQYGRFLDNMDFVLCGVYLESEAFCDFPVNPVRLQAGALRSEVLQLSKDDLYHALSRFHGAAPRFESRTREARGELWMAATSPELGFGQRLIGTRRYRIKTKVLYRGRATDVEDLPRELLSNLTNDWCKSKINLGDGHEAQLREQAQEMYATRRVSAELDDSGQALVVLDSEDDMKLFQRWILPPRSVAKVRLDVFVGFMTFYSAVTIPARFGFELEKSTTFIVIDAFVDSIFVVEMFINFRTGFTDSEGVCNTVVADIRRQYLRTWFAVDIMSTFPFDWILEFGIHDNSTNSRAIKLIRITRFARLLKTMRLLKVAKLVDLANNSVDVSPLAIRMSILCVRIFFMAHIVGCVWFYLSTMPKPWNNSCDAAQLGCSRDAPPTSWLEALGPNSDTGTFVSNYIVTMYWVFTTMTTVGYGDIVPTNDYERAYAIFVMFCGATVFGYIVGSIAGVSTTFVDATSDSLCVLRDYCDERNLPQRMNRYARRHYEFWYQEMTPFGYEDGLLSNLPPALRKEVILFIHRGAIGSLCLFRRPLPDWLAAEMARLLEPQAFLPSESILGPDEAGLHQDIFFVYEGFCEASRSWLRRVARCATRNFLLPDAKFGGRGNLDGRIFEAEGDPECNLLYGPGAAFGYEPLIHEAGLGTLTQEQLYFRCGRTAPCSVFALRHGVLNDIHSDFSQMVQEVLAETIVREARRRRKQVERQRKSWSAAHAARETDARRSCVVAPERAAAFHGSPLEGALGGSMLAARLEESISPPRQRVDAWDIAGPPSTSPVQLMERFMNEEIIGE